MSRLHADGWGTAWATDPAPGHDTGGSLQRIRTTQQPPQGASPLVSAMGNEPTRARLVHLRMATAGLPLSMENTHPFLEGTMAFAHNGAIVPTEPIRQQLTRQTRATVAGQTDSELYFALIRQHVAAGVPLVEAVCEVVNRLRADYPTASLNALLLTQDHLIAVHSSENARLPHKEFAASGLSQQELPRDHWDDYYRISYLQTEQGATVFTSTGIDTDQPTPAGSWVHLPLASVAVVDRTTGTLDIHQLTAPSVASIA
jgi:predicted glutamine amidotransferase